MTAYWVYAIRTSEVIGFDRDDKQDKCRVCRCKDFGCSETVEVILCIGVHNFDRLRSNRCVLVLDLGSSRYLPTCDGMHMMPEVHCRHGRRCDRREDASSFDNSVELAACRNSTRSQLRSRNLQESLITIREFEAKRSELI